MDLPHDLSHDCPNLKRQIDVYLKQDLHDLLFVVDNDLSGVCTFSLPSPTAG